MKVNLPTKWKLASKPPALTPAPSPRSGRNRRRGLAKWCAGVHGLAARILRGIVTLAVLTLALAGCKPASPRAAPRTYTVHGVVQSVAPDQRHAMITHDAIPGYMAAMTMDFTARDPEVLNGVSAGDEVSFTLAVTETNDWMEKVQRLGRTNGFGLSGPPGWHVVEPSLAVGDTLPDYEFADENGQPMRLADFRGQAVALTFFFTSCPLPDYCPRMNRNFAEARNILAAATNAPAAWQLLSISFDPGFDTPQRLSSYARSYRGSDASHWRFGVASSNTLAGLAPKVDLSVWREGGSLSHNLRTVVLDTTGKITRQFDGNDWTPQQLADAILAAARAP
jgi:protein SCO1/2